MGGNSQTMVRMGTTSILKRPSPFSLKIGPGEPLPCRLLLAICPFQSQSLCCSALLLLLLQSIRLDTSHHTLHLRDANFVAHIETALREWVYEPASVLDIGSKHCMKCYKSFGQRGGWRIVSKPSGLSSRRYENGTKVLRTFSCARRRL